MKVILVDNLLLDDWGSISVNSLQPHLGLMSLAAVLNEEGHEAQIYDPKFALWTGAVEWSSGIYEDIADAVLSRRPDVVGLTSLGCNFHCAVRIATSLKRKAESVPILLGGPHATILSHEILSRYPVFDVVARHEAENSIGPLISALESRSYKEVPGITYRNAGGVVANPNAPLIQDLDQLPIPLFDLYPISSVALESIRVEAGRGCPFSCYFCSTAPFFGRNYRLKSAKRLCAELILLNRKYGFTNFSLTHDLFTVNKRKVREFCNAVAPLGFTWGCSARVDCVDFSLLDQMYQAGCRRIYFGVETGSERMQNISQKRLDIKLVQPTVTHAMHLGIDVTASFITGYPEETLEDQRDTISMMGDLAMTGTPNKILVQLHLLAPEPGTHLYAKFASSLQYDGFTSDQTFAMVDQTDMDMVSKDPSIFMIHYYFPGVLTREKFRFVSTAFRLLNEAGPAALSHLLIESRLKLHELLDRLEHWLRTHQSAEISSASLISFLSSLPACQSSLITAYRLAHARAELQTARNLIANVDRRRKTLSMNSPCQYDTVLAISPNCRLIENAVVDDKLRMLDEFGREGGWSYSFTGHTNLAVVLQNRAYNEFALYDLNDESVAILNLFAASISIKDIKSHLNLNSAASARLLNIANQLIRKGLLAVMSTGDEQPLQSRHFVAA